MLRLDDSRYCLDLWQGLGKNWHPNDGSGWPDDLIFTMDSNIAESVARWSLLAGFNEV